MKKVLVLVMVVAMAMSGCCMKALLDSAPVNFVCNPTPAQQQTAAQMVMALQMGVGLAGSFVGITPEQVSAAFAVLTVIKNGGCFLISQLKSAFEVVDASNMALAKAQAKKLKAAPSPLPEYPDLRVFVK